MHMRARPSVPQEGTGAPSSDVRRAEAGGELPARGAHRGPSDGKRNERARARAKRAARERLRRSAARRLCDCDEKEREALGARVCECGSARAKTLELLVRSKLPMSAFSIKRATPGGRRRLQTASYAADVAGRRPAEPRAAAPKRARRGAEICTHTVGREGRGEHVSERRGVDSPGRWQDWLRDRSLGAQAAETWWTPRERTVSKLAPVFPTKFGPRESRQQQRRQPAQRKWHGPTQQPAVQSLHASANGKSVFVSQSCSRRWRDHSHSHI